jgi:CMP-N-acetylneuraminic acid synthetase
MIKKKNFKKIILIPARSGSKRLKNKNILKVKGKRLLFFTIQQALKVKNIDHVIVSTDSLKYAKIAREYGAKVYYLRPKNISKDNSSDFDVFLYNENWVNKNLNFKTDIYIHLRPTFPIREISHINKMIKVMEKNYYNIDSVRSVIKTDFKFEKYYEIDRKNLLRNKYSFFRKKKNNDFMGNQSDKLLNTWYKHNGNIDIFKANLLKKKTISGKRIFSFLQNSKYDYDINTLEDFNKIKKKLISKYF